MARIETLEVSETEDSEKKSREIKRELQRLTLEVLEADEDDDNENDDNNNNNTKIILGKIDNAIKAFSALKASMKSSEHSVVPSKVDDFEKKEEHSVSPKVDDFDKKEEQHSIPSKDDDDSNKKEEQSVSSQDDDFVVPAEFLCPLSKGIMKDPVIISSGVTYDRPYIQKWFDKGNRTCPQTQEVLSSFVFTPNRLAREVIAQWCKDHGAELPPLSEDARMLTDVDRKYISALLAKMTSRLHNQKEAAKELRLLTKQMTVTRSFFRESPNALEQLLRPLTSATGVKKVDKHPDLQEDLIAILFNISLPEENKKVIADYLPALTVLIESLKYGNMQTRGTAAAALFNLSALDVNKVRIAEQDGLKALLELLKQRNPFVMRDACNAIFVLCVHPENRDLAVHQGVARVIFQLIEEGVWVSELLPTLNLLSCNQKAITLLGNLNAAECLLGIIRETKVEADKENCAAILCDLCQYSLSSRNIVQGYEEIHKTLLGLAQSGTPRAKRKAKSLLDGLMPRQEVSSPTESG